MHEAGQQALLYATSLLSSQQGGSPGSMGEPLPDMRTGIESQPSEEKCNGNIYTISQPCSSGRSSPTNMSFRMRNLQPDSVSANHVRPPSSEESLESNRSAIRQNLRRNHIQHQSQQDESFNAVRQYLGVMNATSEEAED
ncbi:hypothetical protein HPB49_003004 [Dermacentor silvarum]|uniref:Uncharacterized protein n=1 Tax=Dermacentor silvarum TaxID=543639 RepID=A0ACB8CUY5_DERSI|nr:hypothetical protein HPB49_003004 [Dermacentor silvarum]